MADSPGANLLNRRAKNLAQLIEPVSVISRLTTVVMTNPEITKKTSTPVNPPGIGSPAWNEMTIKTAIARSPCMSCLRLLCASVVLFLSIM